MPSSQDVISLCKDILCEMKTVVRVEGEIQINVIKFK